MTPKGDRIQIRFTFNGEDLRPTWGERSPTNANMLAARRLRRLILDEIRDGVFSLSRHLPDDKHAEKHAGTDDAGQRTLKAWFEVWAKASARGLEHSTLVIYQRHMRAYWLPRFGGSPPRRITQEALATHRQVALPWTVVDLRSATIAVRGAQVLGKAKDRTKTHAERTVEFNARAAAVLTRRRARTQAPPHGKVFAAAGQPSKPWRDEQVQWRAWNRVLRLTGLRYRAPKECRDTSVTLALAAGASPVRVAAQHGHSVQVMLTSYARWIPSADRAATLRPSTWRWPSLRNGRPRLTSRTP